MSGGDQNWQVGDLALCVRRDAWAFQGQGMNGPRFWSVHRVHRVGIFSEADLASIDFPTGKAGIWLGFQEFLPAGFHACGFRKIAPYTPDDEDAETIRLLTGQPVAPKRPELV